MNIINKIIDMDGIKWLQYGFFVLTGIKEDHPEVIITYLKSIYKFTNDDIVRLVTARYLLGVRGPCMIY